MEEERIAEEQEIDVEREFRKVSCRVIPIASLYSKFAEIVETIWDKRYSYNHQEILNVKGTNYALSAELSLKANIIFDVFRKNPKFSPSLSEFNQWLQDIASQSAVGDPKKILKMVKEFDSDSEVAKTIDTDPRKNDAFQTLTGDNKKPGGHSLYTYYQLQSAVVKSLINVEFLCSVENDILWTFYPLLFNSIEGNIQTPKFMKELNEVKNYFPDFRYSSISLKSIKTDELHFLKNFAESLISVGDYRFREPEDRTVFANSQCTAAEKEFLNSNGIVLDKVTQYYLKSDFDEEEIKVLFSFLKEVTNENNQKEEQSVFINVCIYLKYCIKHRLGMKVKFTVDELKFIRDFSAKIRTIDLLDNSNIKKIADIFPEQRTPSLNAITLATTDYCVMPFKAYEASELEASELVEERYRYEGKISGFVDVEYGYYKSSDGYLWKSVDSYLAYKNTNSNKNTSGVVMSQYDTVDKKADEDGGYIGKGGFYYIDGCMWRSREQYKKFKLDNLDNPDIILNDLETLVEDSTSPIKK